MGVIELKSVFSGRVPRFHEVGCGFASALMLFVLAPVGAMAASAGIGFSAHISSDIASGLSPLSGETISFVEDAGFRLVVSNPGSSRSDIRVAVYDERFRRIEAQTFPSSVSLGSGASSEVTVIVPFAGNAARDLNICAERVVSGGTERQVCGRYKIRRVSLD